MQERFAPEAHPPSRLRRDKLAENWPPTVREIEDFAGDDIARKILVENWVYVLWSPKIRKRYIGCTVNVGARLAQHNAGETRFTKGGMPWILIHLEKLPDLSSARKRELLLKSGFGRAWLDSRYPEFIRAAQEME